MNTNLIKEYTTLLRELSDLRLTRFPEKLLPASKDQIKKEIEQQSVTNTEHFNWAELSDSLNMFQSDIGDSGGFVVSLTASPFGISIVYAIWIAFRGASWLWIPASLALFVGATIMLFMSLLNDKSSFKVNLLLSFLHSMLGLLTFCCNWAIFARLFFLSGFYGLYTSAIKTFSLTGIVLSLISICFGFHYAKVSNRLYYFLFTNRYDGTSYSHP